MCTTRTSRPKSKRGVSTVLGTLIFIGILFTSIVPMYLVMKQADALYDKKKVAMGLQDQERSRENLDFYAFPPSPFAQDVTVRIKNRCELAVKIVRLWINDIFIETNWVLPSVNEMETSIHIEPVGGSSYNLRITTDRGNVFTSQTGTLYYDATSGWQSEFFAIYVVISTQGVKFKITITNSSNAVVYDKIVLNPGGSSSDKSSIIETCEVAGPGTYHVDIFKSRSGGWDLIYAEYVTIPWPEGPQFAWVYA